MSYAETDRESGYVVLVTVLIGSAIMVLIATATAGALRTAHSHNAAATETFQARALAESCMETALLRRKIDGGDYGGDETVAVGDETCTIRPITGSAPITLETEAASGSAAYRLRARVDEEEFTLESWERVANF